MLDNDPHWLAMVEDRNRTSHTYDEESAKAIYQALRTYADLLRTLVGRLGAGYHRRETEGL